MTNPATRDVTVTASALATLNEITEGRMDLGIGRGDSGENDLGLRWGNGPFVAGTYGEAMGAHAWGGLLGYSITLGTAK